MAEPNQNQDQAQQSAQGAGTAGQAQQATNQQKQGTQQAEPPAIDYGKIQQMLDGALAAREDTALKAYFKQQGLSQQEAEQAITTFKQQKADNTPDVGAMQAQVTQAQAAAQQSWRRWSLALMQRPFPTSLRWQISARSWDRMAKSMMRS